MARLSRYGGLLVTSAALLAAALAALAIWWGDILQALLDPEVPYAVYGPPPAPDYDRASAWAILPSSDGIGAPPVDLFFIHPTTFDGGRNWNGPIDDRGAARLMARVMAPNYASPFASVARIFAPRYRQASLYASLTLFDDAIEAREFAYRDVRAAFMNFRHRTDPLRPFILVGVEQGGALATRLVTDEIATDPALSDRLVAGYLIETVAPADIFARGATPPACSSRSQAGCVLAWASASWFDFGRVRGLAKRSVVWSPSGRLVPLNGRRPLCVNPLYGAATDRDAPPRLNQGAANATGLEWGARPGFLARQIGARCVDGILRITRARSSSLRPSGGWAQRLRVAPYNLFWADLEADAQARVGVWRAAHPASAIGSSGRQSYSSRRIRSA